MAEEKDKLVSALPAEDDIEESSETQEMTTPLDASVPISKSESSRNGSVRVLHNVLGLFIAPEIATETEQEAESRRRLNEVIHGMLITGLVVSTAIIFLGLAIGVILHRPLPSRASNFRQILDGLKGGSPSSFLDLGILLLIATPILRVVGSLIEFINMRDWRYVVITSLVLLILAVSVLVGSG